MERPASPASRRSGSGTHSARAWIGFDAPGASPAGSESRRTPAFREETARGERPELLDQVRHHEGHVEGAGEAPGVQLQHRERVDGRPVLDVGPATPEGDGRGRVAAADAGDAGVDAARVRRERVARGRVETVEVAGGQGRKVEVPGQAIGRKPFAPDHRGGPTAGTAPQPQHLAQAVLCVREAEPEERVALVGGLDARNPVGVAEDLDGRADPVHLDPTLDERQRVADRRAVAQSVEQHAGRRERGEQHDRGSPG